MLSTTKQTAHLKNNTYTLTNDKKSSNSDHILRTKQEIDLFMKNDPLQSDDYHELLSEGDIFSMFDNNNITSSSDEEQ